MMNGTDQLELINQHIAKVRMDLGAIQQRMEIANQRSVQLRKQLTEAYRQLARLRLDELAAEKVATQLDHTDRAVLELLERRSQDQRRLDKAIELAAELQAQLGTQREQMVRERDDLVNQIDENAAEVRSQLGSQEAYRSLQQQVTETAARAELAEKKASQAEADQQEKGRPYRDDPLFMYLWKRRYLTPDYTGGWLTRTLDGWVARLINYADARANYFMLTELPVRLREHADQQKAIAAQTLEKLHGVEDQALQTDVIIRDKKALTAAQKSLEEIEAHMDEAEKQHEELLKERSAFSSAADPTWQQALELQLSEIKSETLADLYAQARATRNPDDDVIVSRIKDLQQDEEKLDAEVKELLTLQNKQQQSYQELEDLRRRFRQRSFDSRHSYFPGGLELAGLIGMLLSGRTSGRSVWDRIEQEQRFRRPRTPRGFGSGGIFSGGFGGGFGGGFSSGGKMGGGGFRTGGNF